MAPDFPTPARVVGWLTGFLSATRPRSPGNQQPRLSHPEPKRVVFGGIERYRRAGGRGHGHRYLASRRGVGSLGLCNGRAICAGGHESRRLGNRRPGIAAMPVSFSLVLSPGDLGVGRCFDGV